MMFRGDKLLSYIGLFLNKLIIEVLLYFDFLYKKPELLVDYLAMT